VYFSVLLQITLAAEAHPTKEINRLNNNPIQIFIIYVPSQQLQGQLQTQRSVDTGNYIMDKHNIKPKINYMKLLEENTLMEKVNKQR
jgi:hypothetical protein